MLEPNTKEVFPIRFFARISKPVYGRIIFTNCKDDSGQTAATMVFNLASKIVGRTPDKIV